MSNFSDVTVETTTKDRFFFRDSLGGLFRLAAFPCRIEPWD